MKQPLLKKILLISLLSLLLLIPLTLIEDVVRERSNYRYQAQNSIAQSWTGAQHLFGPVLVVPYREHYSVRVWNKESKQYENKAKVSNKQLLLNPGQLKIDGRVDTEMRQRGIYAVPVFLSDLKLSGYFDLKALGEVTASSARSIEWLPAHVAVMVSDVRGIKEQPVINWGSASHEFKPDSLIEGLRKGMHAPVGILKAGGERIDFDFDLKLNGMEALRFSPLGDSTTVTVNSDWSDPSFIGRYLPSSREIDDDGFNAIWQLSSFSSNIPQQLSACAAGECSNLMGDDFGVRLFNSVDIYQQSERSVKYALLFIGLTFMSFFLYEIMRGLRLHPMQYLLVGLGLSVFYLLLISLSEHMAFHSAYAIASGASTTLIGVYVSSILQSRMHGGIISGTLLLLYAMLFGILRSEDNSLLMGSLLSFVILSLFMIATRRVDWYAVTDELAASLPARNRA